MTEVTDGRIVKGSHIEVFEDIPGVKAFFTLKERAVRGYPYDDRGFFRELGLCDAVPVWPKQVHGTEVRVISKDDVENAADTPECGEGAAVRLDGVDAVVTDVPGVLLTTVHADCIPVYLFDRERKAAGLAHAGWRGTAGGIAAKTLETMREAFGSRPEDISAYIGPGISMCCFETGSEVYEEFAAKWDFTGEYAEKHVKDDGAVKYHIDIKGINRRRLADAGVPEEDIATDSRCTCCMPELFTSYRREKGTYMRMGAGICIAQEGGRA